MGGVRLRTAALFFVLAVVVGAAVYAVSGRRHTPTVDEYLKKSSIGHSATIRIGVGTDQPLLGYREPDGQLSGFDIEIARYLATQLGFRERDISFVPLDTADRVRSLEIGQVDLVVAALAMTEARRQLIGFAGPYLVTSQQVMVRKQDRRPLDTLDALRGLRLCTVAGTTSEAYLRARQLAVEAVALHAQCVDGLAQGRYDAVVADSIVLAGYVFQHSDRFELVHLPIDESSRYGIGVPKSDPYLRDLVAHFLMESYRRGADGAWQKAWDRTLGLALLGTYRQPRPDIVRGLGSYPDEHALPGHRTPAGRLPTTRRRSLARPSRRRHRPRPGRPRPRRARAVTGTGRLPRTGARSAVIGRTTAAVTPAPGTPAGPDRAVGRQPDRQALWTVVVGVPAVVSVLRLWVESGGELQTTLLLVANVAPVNLIGAVVATATWLVTAALVAVFAVGAALRASSGGPGPAYPFARWTTATPGWLKVAAFAGAALSWQLLYLPLLLLAGVMTYQLRWPTRRGTAVVTGIVAAGAFLIVFGRALAAAAVQRDLFVVALVTAPILVAPLASGPLVPAAARPFALVTHAVVPVLVILGTVPLLRTPVLPRVVVEVGAEDSAERHYVRGHIIRTDDAMTLILRERRGVLYIPNTEVKAVSLCPQRRETPGVAPRVRGFLLEESILQGLGRSVRTVDPPPKECRIPLAA